MATTFVETAVALMPAKHAVSAIVTGKGNNQLVAMATSSSKWQWGARKTVGCRNSHDFQWC